MSDHNEIEDLFRDKFQNFSTSPPPGLWDKIATDIGAQNRKGGIWFFNLWGRIFSVVVLVTFFISGMFFGIMNEPNVYKNSETEKELKEYNTANLTESLFKEPNKNQEVTKESNENIVKKADNNNPIETIKLDSKNSAEGLKTKKQSQNAITANSVIVDENENSIFNEVPPVAEGSNNLNSERSFSSNNSIFPEESRKNENISQISPLGFNPIIESQNIVGSKFEDEKNENFANKPQFFVEAYGGPSFAFRRFNSNHSLMYSHKQQAESQLISYDWGIAIGLTKGKWQFSIGGQIERLGEKYNFDGFKEVHDTSITSHQHPQDPTVLVYDTAIEVHQNEVGHHTQNIYNYLTIPISVGYEVRVSPNFKVVPVITTGVNFLLNAQASWLDPESMDAVSHSSGDGTNAYRKVNFSNKFQIGLHYALTEKLTFIVRPEAALLWKSVFNNSEFLNHRPYSLDANFGIRYSIK